MSSKSGLLNDSGVNKSYVGNIRVEHCYKQLSAY